MWSTLQERWLCEDDVISEIRIRHQITVLPALCEPLNTDRPCRPITALGRPCPLFPASASSWSPSPLITLHVAHDHLRGTDNNPLLCLEPSMGPSTWGSQLSGADTAWLSSNHLGSSTHSLQHLSNCTPHLTTTEPCSQKECFEAYGGPLSASGRATGSELLPQAAGLGLRGIWPTIDTDPTPHQPHLSPFPHTLQAPATLASKEFF